MDRRGRLARPFRTCHPPGRLCFMALDCLLHRIANPWLANRPCLLQGHGRSLKKSGSDNAYRLRCCNRALHLTDRNRPPHRVIPSQLHPRLVTSHRHSRRLHPAMEHPSIAPNQSHCQKLSNKLRQSPCGEPCKQPCGFRYKIRSS